MLYLPTFAIQCVEGSGFNRCLGPTKGEISSLSRLQGNPVTSWAPWILKLYIVGENKLLQIIVIIISQKKSSPLGITNDSRGWHFLPRYFCFFFVGLCLDLFLFGWFITFDSTMVCIAMKIHHVRRCFCWILFVSRHLQQIEKINKSESFLMTQTQTIKPSFGKFGKILFGTFPRHLFQQILSICFNPHFDKKQHTKVGSSLFRNMAGNFGDVFKVSAARYFHLPNDTRCLA